MMRHTDVLMVLEKHVVNVRRRLKEEYEESNHDLAGLCDLSCEYLTEILKEEYPGWECSIMHGELAHSTKILSKYWEYEHTILRVTVNDKDYYIDPTISQFRNIFKISKILNKNYIYLVGRETYYIGWDVEPKYMLFDRDNYIIGLYNKEWFYNKWPEKLLKIYEYRVKGFIYDLVGSLLR